MTDRERKTFVKCLRAILGELNRRKVQEMGFDKLPTPDLPALALKCSEALRPEKENGGITA